MRKIVLFNLVSLDGYFAGPDGEIDWHLVDDEFNQFAVEQTRKFETLLFGRITYQLMESYWPVASKDPKISKEDLLIADIMNSAPKVVYSKTLQEVSWNNTTLQNTVDPEEIIKLKSKPGGDIAIFGSADLASTFTKHNLIDEYRLLVNPIVLGKGKPLFKNVETRLTLKLADTRKFRNGNVLLTYVRTKT